MLLVKLKDFLPIFDSNCNDYFLTICCQNYVKWWLTASFINDKWAVEGKTSIMRLHEELIQSWKLYLDSRFLRWPKPERNLAMNLIPLWQINITCKWLYLVRMFVATWSMISFFHYTYNGTFWKIPDTWRLFRSCYCLSA